LTEEEFTATYLTYVPEENVEGEVYSDPDF
jgi:hypothetical protein